jgi:hypothetical protein
MVLRAGIWGALSRGSNPVFKTEWKSLIRQAKGHAVQALIADGAGLLSEEQRPSLQQIASLSLAVDAIETGNERVNAVLKSMAAYWEKAGVKAVLLKGQGLAGIYPNPLHRTPGDIDWYFPEKDNFSKALALIRAKGFAPEIDGDGDYHYSVNGVVVEHHQNWCDLSNPFKLRRVVEIENNFGYTFGPEYNTLSPLTNLIQLNVHILKHVLVMGIGWRQLCDLALATKHYQGQYSKEDYCQAIRKLGLTRWAKLLYGVLAKYLGTDCAWMPVAPKFGRDADRLAELIMRCGNFGRESGKRMLGSYLSASLLLFRYVPGEVLWRPLRLAGNRFSQLFRRKNV